MKIFVFSIGGSKSVENSSTMSIKLSVPTKVEAVEKMNAPRFRPLRDIKDEIANALKLAQDAVKEANVGVLKSEMTYELKFTVSWKNEGGIDIPDLLPVDISAKKTKKKTQIHTLKVVFK